MKYVGIAMIALGGLAFLVNLVLKLTNVVDWNIMRLIENQLLCIFLILVGFITIIASTPNKN